MFLNYIKLSEITDFDQMYKQTIDFPLKGTTSPDFFSFVFHCAFYTHDRI